MTHTQAAGPADLTEVRGYGLALNRMYDPDTHMWVQPLGDARARIGMDPLGVETSGTLAQLSFLPVGTELARGRPFGQLEAAKFLGPLVSPMSGTLLASNDMVAADPALTERVPFGAGWLVELELRELADDAEPQDRVGGLVAAKRDLAELSVGRDRGLRDDHAAELAVGRELLLVAGLDRLLRRFELRRDLGAARGCAPARRGPRAARLDPDGGRAMTRQAERAPGAGASGKAC